jgi:hypothetical protein
MVGAQVLDLADGGGEAHGEVEEQVALVLVGGEAGEIAYVVGGCLAPSCNDEEGKEQATIFYRRSRLFASISQLIDLTWVDDHCVRILTNRK